KVLNIGDKVEVKYTSVDRKNRIIILSFCEKDEADDKDTITSLNKQEDANFATSTMAEAFKAAKGE
ncbi:MAG: 30S ribosomal protein S1, partial [Arsenophonus sp. ET-DL12-MAG3]